MPGPPSPPSGTQRPSLRWDAAQRACRDNDLKSLKLLIEQGALFENISSLQEACKTGAWGTGSESSSSQSFSTTDSIRLSNLLQTATTRGHVRIITYLLQVFPAKDLHVLEWEITINAIAQGSVQVLSPFLEVDPGLVNMQDPRFGTCFSILFNLVIEKEKHLPVVQLLCTSGADLAKLPDVFYNCAMGSTPDVLEYLESRTKSLESDERLLQIASSHGNEGMVTFLLDRGADKCDGGN